MGQGEEARLIGRSWLRKGAANSGGRVASGAAGLLRFANKKQTVIILILLDEFRAEKER